MGACSLVKSGLNLRKEEQAIASWTIPSCHKNAAKTARAHSATEGDMACLAGSVTRDVLSPLNRGPDLSFLGRVCRLEVLRLTLGDERLSSSSLTGALPMLKCTLHDPSSALRNSTFSSLPSSLDRRALEVHTSTTSLWRFSWVTCGEGTRFSALLLTPLFGSLGDSLGLGEVDLPLSGSVSGTFFFLSVSGSRVYESDLDLSLGGSSRALEEGLTLGGRFLSWWVDEECWDEVLEGLDLPEEDPPFCLGEEEREPGFGESARSPGVLPSAFRACRVL